MSQDPTVLVVGGDVVQIELIKAALEAVGLRVATTEDGFEALALLRQEKPSVLVLDVNLSEPNAVEVLRWVASEFGSRSPRILGVIMPGEAELEHRCQALGVDLFIHESFSPERMAQGVEGLIASAP